MAAFVQGRYAAAQTEAFSSNVTKGNLLVCYQHGYSSGATIGISDTIGNSWQLVKNFYQSGLTGAALWYCITKSSGSNTVTTTGSTSSPAILIGEYSGSSGLSSVVTQSLADDATAVSCGPISANKGVIVFMSTFSQATGYTSSSELTTRETEDATRAGFGDNLTATKSYTESGTFSGTMSFGALIMMASFLPQGSGSQVGWTNRQRNFVNKR